MRFITTRSLASLSLFLIARSPAFSQAVLTQNNGVVTQSLYNAYWSTADGFRSLAELHNNLISAPLTVTPVVYAADGWSVRLDDVNLPPLGNATLNLADQLAAKGWAGALYGSMVFQYQRRNSGALSAELYVENALESISFTIPSSWKPPTSAVQNAVFWIPSRNAEVYVALQNVAGVPINVSPVVTMYGHAMPLQPVQLPPHGLAVIDIGRDAVTAVLENAWAKNAFGGVTVTQDGPPGALNTGGWIEDDQRGYSTTMTFQDPTVGRGRLVGTQILVGRAEALLNLSDPFNISSELVLRDVSSEPLDFHGELAFSDNNGKLLRTPIQATHLAAGEVICIDLDQLKTDAEIPAFIVSASIALEYSGNAGALMGRVYGVSADQSYGFYWALQPSAGNSYSESFWTTEGSWIPVLTVANFSTAPDEVTVELTSNNGLFKLAPFGLQPLESRTINVRDLLNSGVPGQDGKSLPPGTDYGGYRIYGASQHGQLMVKEHLIDPVSKLSTPFYGGYTYANDLYFVPTYQSSWDPNTDAPYSVAVSGGDTSGIYTYIDYSDGTTGGGCPYGSPHDAYWVDQGSNNATVTRNGCIGVVTGTQVGSASIYAYEMDLIIDSSGDGGDLVSTNAAQITVVANPCFAQLKYRPVDQVPQFNHSFWWIQTSTPAHYVIDGGPTGSFPFYGYLNDWVTLGDVGSPFNGEDNQYDSLAWYSGTSGSVCIAVNTLYTYALGWPENAIQYYVADQNSNTFAHDAANAAGFTNVTAPPNARGW